MVVQRLSCHWATERASVSALEGQQREDNVSAKPEKLSVPSSFSKKLDCIEVRRRRDRDRDFLHPVTFHKHPRRQMSNTHLHVPESSGDGAAERPIRVNKSPKVAPRLGHKKSRTGCQQCRARRIKVRPCFCSAILLPAPDIIGSIASTLSFSQNH